MIFCNKCGGNYLGSVSLLSKSLPRLSTRGSEPSSFSLSVINELPQCLVRRVIITLNYNAVYKYYESRRTIFCNHPLGGTMQTFSPFFDPEVEEEKNHGWAPFCDFVVQTLGNTHTSRLWTTLLEH